MDTNPLHDPDNPLLMCRTAAAGRGEACDSWISSESHGLDCRAHGARDHCVNIAGGESPHSVQLVVHFFRNERSPVSSWNFNDILDLISIDKINGKHACRLPLIDTRIVNRKLPCRPYQV